jgi:predicted metalloprotease with PDZ domain
MRRRVAKSHGFLVAFAFFMILPAHAQPASDPIRYTLRFPAPQTHYVEVAAVVPTGGRPSVDLTMAVWTPGSYLIREYERHVEGLSAAAGGKALAVEQTAKNIWRIATGGARALDLRYRVYAREMAVRTNWVETDFAMLNGAATFMALASMATPFEITIELPAAWKQSFSGLPSGKAPHSYVAPDFDTLVDSPIVIGNPDVHEFTVSGKKHYLVNTPATETFDSARAVKDLQRIVEEQLGLWGSLPYDQYLFLNMITEAGGGIEHKNSTLLMTNRWTTRTRKAYLSWLELCSHEYFHAWNVKRLRPIELGPFNYQSEVYTRALWISEGFTDYYGELLVHRAGLSTRDEYLEALSNQIEGLQTTPGRLVRSAAQASFDTWIKQYRPDENSPNVSISYYTKGAVIAFLLDAKIRGATNGAKSLDDVMREAFAKYSGERGFTLEQFRDVAERVAGTDLEAFWHRTVESTEELEYDEALEVFGLAFKPPEPPKPDKPARAWLGAATRNENGRLLVSQVRRGTPAHEAGLNVDDEIIAIDDYRVRADRLEDRLEQYAPGNKVSFLVARREHLVRIPVTLGTEPLKTWRLRIAPTPSEAQQHQLAVWLSHATP